MSRLADKIRVEPLTPDRVDQVERAVLAAYRATEPAAPVRRWGWLKVAVPVAAACAVVVAFWFGGRAATDAPVAAAPTRVETPPGDPTRIDLGDAVITVGGDTALSIDRAGGGIAVTLDRGTVDCEVEPREARPPFVVHAADVDVIVVGTLFRVERDGDDVRVQVTRGKVRVEAAGASALVAAGQAWQDGAVELAVADEVDEATPAEPGETEPVIASADPAEPRDPEVAAPEPARRRATRQTTRRAAEPKPKSTAKQTVGVAPVPTVAKPGSKGGTGADLYREAHDAYFRDHNSRLALSKIDHFLRRFAKADYTEDVLKLRIRILCTEPSSACRKAAHTYLRLYPSGDYAASARALTNWM